MLGGLGQKRQPTLITPARDNAIEGRCGPVPAGAQCAIKRRVVGIIPRCQETVRQRNVRTLASQQQCGPEVVARSDFQYAKPATLEPKGRDDTQIELRLMLRVVGVGLNLCDVPSSQRPWSADPPK